MNLLQEIARREQLVRGPVLRKIEIMSSINAVTMLVSLIATFSPGDTAPWIATAVIGMVALLFLGQLHLLWLAVCQRRTDRAILARFHSFADREHPVLGPARP